jgi:serine phosphatase RsbU (regulator of sigma subunit)
MNINSIFEHFNKLSKYHIFVRGYLTLALIVLIDFLTERDLSVIVLYFFPIIIVTWYTGRISGLIISMVSGFCWFAANSINNHASIPIGILYWNFVEILVVFNIISFIISTLKMKVEEAHERELEIAREVQSHLRPQELIRMKGLDYIGDCKSAFQVSGDYYDFIQIDQHKLGIAIGDVCGKGIHSALLMANLQGLLRSYAQIHKDDLSALMSKINQALFISSDTSKFATLFYGIYDERQRTLTHVNAGHNPLILFRHLNELTIPQKSQDNLTEFELNHNYPSFQYNIYTVGTKDLVIGSFPETSYTQKSIELKSRDLFVMYTDGITESRNNSDEEYGEERLIRTIAENITHKPNKLRDIIFDDIKKFTGETSQFDDMTLIVAKIE